MTRKTFIKNLKMLFAAHHYVFNSQEIADIAVVINLSPKRVEKLMQADEWAEAVAYWKGNPVGKEGDLGLAEKLWAYMVENGEHTNLVEYPDTPFSAPKGAGDPDVYALIQSHLFCVDNLCDDEIRSRIAEERKFESPPVKYEGQALSNPYHYWIYPNYEDGIFSKCFARVNIAGDLVIDFAGETCLVCIRYGRLTFTRQVSDDVVSVSDERLLVCL